MITFYVKIQLFSHFGVLLSRGGSHSQTLANLPPVLACLLKLLEAVCGPKIAERDSGVTTNWKAEEYYWGEVITFFVLEIVFLVICPRSPSTSVS